MDVVLVILNGQMPRWTCCSVQMGTQFYTKLSDGHTVLHKTVRWAYSLIQNCQMDIQFYTKLSDGHTVQYKTVMMSMQFYTKLSDGHTILHKTVRWACQTGIQFYTKL